MTLMEKDARERLIRAAALRITLEADADNAMGVWQHLNTARMALGSDQEVLDALSVLAGNADIMDDEWAALHLGYAASKLVAVERGPEWRESLQFEIDALITLNQIDGGLL
jgi:hypothetical protein